MVFAHRRPGIPNWPNVREEREYRVDMSNTHASYETVFDTVKERLANQLPLT